MSVIIRRWQELSKERPVSAVPRSIVMLLIVSFLLQIMWHAQQAKPVAVAAALRTAPSPHVLELLSVGDPVALSKLLMLRLQAYDHQPGISIPLIRLDYHKVVSWLQGIVDLDPDSQYPLLAAARLYAHVNDAEKKRIMLKFVHSNFLKKPDLQWPAMVHAVFIAKHRLKDLELALQYAKDIRLHVKRQDLHSWVKQMELFVLEDMGDLESARILLGGFLESGVIEDEQEFKFLQDRLGAGNN